MGSFTHVIQVPPMTDTMMLVGAYRTLMDTIGIECGVLAQYPSSSGVTHPIASAQQILADDFSDTYHMLMVSYMFHGSLSVTNMRFMMNCCVFTFTHPD